MTELTAKVIMVCKAHYDERTTEWVNSKNLDVMEQLRWWLSSYTGAPLTCIPDDDIKAIVAGAMIDYLNSCSNPGQIFGEVFDRIGRGYDSFHALVTTLRLVKVRTNANDYINGFSKELIEPIALFPEKEN